MSLDPDPESMRRIGYAAVDRIVEHLAHLDGTRVARRHTAAALAARVDEPLPEQGHGIEASLARFFDDLLPAATLVNHPRFFTYIPGPGSFAGAIGAWVAAATNCFVGTWLGGASMAQLELQVLGWLREAAGLPDVFEGVLTTGGSLANLSGIAAARTAASDPTQAVVYTSVEAHYSVAKATRVLGIDHLRDIRVDGDLRMDAAAADAAIRADRAAGLQPIALCATAGTTNTGAVDPLPELRALCDRHGLWLHIDAAYGGALAFVPEERPLLDGFAAADSITFDPHKWLYAPFECGCLLTRRLPELVRAFTADGAYMQDVPREEVNFFERGPELSRGNRALKVWMLLRSVGVAAIRDAIRDDLRLCRLAHDLLREDERIEIVTPPSMSVFSFRVAGGDAAGRDLVERILEDGQLMVSSSRVNGHFVVRFCVANHRTTEADIRRSVTRIRELLD